MHLIRKVRVAVGFAIGLVVMVGIVIFIIRFDSGCKEWLAENSYTRAVGCLGIDSQGIVHGRR